LRVVSDCLVLDVIRRERKTRGEKKKKGSG